MWVVQDQISGADQFFRWFNPAMLVGLFISMLTLAAQFGEVRTKVNAMWLAYERQAFPGRRRGDREQD